MIKEQRRNLGLATLHPSHWHRNAANNATIRRFITSWTKPDYVKRPHQHPLNVEPFGLQPIAPPYVFADPDPKKPKKYDAQVKQVYDSDAYVRHGMLCDNRLAPVSRFTIKEVIVRGRRADKLLIDRCEFCRHNKKKKKIFCDLNAAYILYFRDEQRCELVYKSGRRVPFNKLDPARWPDQQMYILPADHKEPYTAKHVTREDLFASGGNGSSSPSDATPPGRPRSPSDTPSDRPRSPSDTPSPPSGPRARSSPADSNSPPALRGRRPARGRRIHSPPSGAPPPPDRPRSPSDTPSDRPRSPSDTPSDRPRSPSDTPSDRPRSPSDTPSPPSRVEPMQIDSPVRPVADRPSERSDSSDQDPFARLRQERLRLKAEGASREEIGRLYGYYCGQALRNPVIHPSLAPEDQRHLDIGYGSVDAAASGYLDATLVAEESSGLRVIGRLLRAVELLQRDLAGAQDKMDELLGVD